MTADEIAETLINGNISDARTAILNGNVAYRGDSEQAAAVTALDVLESLASTSEGSRSGNATDWIEAKDRLRRCLDPHGEIR